MTIIMKLLNHTNDIVKAADKTGYPHDSFLISPLKHMLWLLIRSASARHF